MNLPLDIPPKLPPGTPPGTPPEVPLDIPPEVPPQIREPEFPGEHAPISDGPRFSTAPSSGGSAIFAAYSLADRPAPIAFNSVFYRPTFH